MNSETKKKIEDLAYAEYGELGVDVLILGHDGFILGAEYGYTLALEQANEILVKALELTECSCTDSYHDKTCTLLSAIEALEAWQKITEGEK